MHEDDLLFDAEEGREEETALPHHPTSPTSKGKQQEAEQERARSETADFEHPQETVETLPKYEKEDSHSHEEEMSDWEKPGSDDEGDYVKINVN